MERAQAMRKIAALLEKRPERGATIEESATALAKAQDLMDRFNLTRVQVERAGLPLDGPITSFFDYPGGWLDAMSQWKAWRWTVAHGLAELHGCFCWKSARKRVDETSGEARAIEIIGRPDAVDAVRYFYLFLTAEINRLVEIHGRGMGQVWRREFAEGAAHRIIERLKLQRLTTLDSLRAEASASTALVVIDQNAARIQQDRAAAEAHGYSTLKLKKQRGKRKFKVSAEARGVGAKAADTININQSHRQLKTTIKQIGGGQS